MNVFRGHEVLVQTVLHRTEVSRLSIAALSFATRMCL